MSFLTGFQVSSSLLSNFISSPFFSPSPANINNNNESNSNQQQQLFNKFRTWCEQQLRNEKTVVHDEIFSKSTTTNSEIANFNSFIENFNKLQKQFLDEVQEESCSFSTSTEQQQLRNELSFFPRYKTINSTTNRYECPNFGSWNGPSFCTKCTANSRKNAAKGGEFFNERQQQIAETVLELQLRSSSRGSCIFCSQANVEGRINPAVEKEPLEEIRRICESEKVQSQLPNGFCDNNILREPEKTQQEHHEFNSPHLHKSSVSNSKKIINSGSDNKNVSGRIESSGGRSSSTTGQGDHVSASSTGGERSSGTSKGTASRSTVHSDLPNVENSLEIRRGPSSSIESNNNRIRNRNSNRLEQQNEVNSIGFESSRHLDQCGGKGRNPKNSETSSRESSSSFNAVPVLDNLVRQVAEDSSSSSKSILSSQLQGRCSDDVGSHGGVRSHQTENSISDGEAQGRQLRSSSINDSSLHQRCGDQGSSQRIINSNEIDALEPRNRLSATSSEQQQQQHSESGIRFRSTDGGRRRGISKFGSIRLQQRGDSRERTEDDDGRLKNDTLANVNSNNNNTNPFNFFPSHVGASIKFRRNNNKVADEQQLQTLPYHSKSVKRYNMKVILDRANNSTNLRLKEVIHLINRPFGDDLNKIPTVPVPMSKSAKQHHTKKRLEHDIIRVVSKEEEQQYPSRGTLHEFCVVEQKKDSKNNTIFDRLRQIDHPVEQNESLRNNKFITTAPLHHFSRYHRRIRHEKALIADLEASFYGYGLDDPVARSFYRFRDETGQLFEMNVLMMGLVASVELQQIITSIIAGHKDYVKPNFVAPTVPEIWVDNMRFCGSEKLLNKCKTFLINSMQDCNASLEIEDISSVYDFLGATWDHENKTVKLAEKTFKKLPSILPNEISARDLEGLIGRLIFVAQIMQDPLVNHYWLLKWARRFFNGLNSGRISPEEMVKIPPSASFSLSRWLSAASKPHKVRFSNLLDKTGTLFTDASLFGWGAVLIMPDGSIQVAGGKLTVDDHKNNINTAEAMALKNSFNSFKNFISFLSNLDILVDNTSLEYNVRRGMPRSEELAIFIKQIWQKIFDLKISISINRVSTKLNPADSISRGQKLDMDKLNNACGEFQKQKASNTSNKRMGLEERHVLSS